MDLKNALNVVLYKNNIYILDTLLSNRADRQQNHE